MHRPYCDIFTAKKNVDVLYLTTSDLGSRDESRGLCSGIVIPRTVIYRSKNASHIYGVPLLSIAVAARIGKPPHFLLINRNIAADARD